MSDSKVSEYTAVKNIVSFVKSYVTERNTYDDQKNVDRI